MDFAVPSVVALTLVVLVVVATILALTAPSPWWPLWPWGRLHWAVAAILIAVWLCMMLAF